MGICDCLDCGIERQQGELQEAAWRKFYNASKDLGHQEIEVLALLAQRLLLGQRNYAKLDLENDTRDFKKERSEEIQDLLIYSAFDTLRSTMKGSATTP